MTFYSRNIVQEALISSMFAAKTVFLEEGINKDPKITQIIQSAKGNRVEISYVSKKSLRKITGTDEHQGAAVELDFKTSNLKDLIKDNAEPNCFIYLTEGTYEHNLGAIIRTAELAGLKGVIIPNTTKVTSTVARASAGALFHVPIIKDSIFNSIKTLKKQGYQILGIERNGTPYFETDLTQDTLLIIGGEDKGITEPIEKKCDGILTIPQLGKTNSLNMSVAAGIVMFERVRQLKIS